MSHPRIPDDVLNRLARAQRVSDGELKALKLALQQRRSKDIARKLGISEAATRKRLGEVYKKFGIKGRGPGKLASLQRHLIAQAVDSVPVAPVPVPSLSPQIEQHSEPVAPFRSSVALPDNPDLKTEYLWNDAPALSLFEGRREPLMHLKQWVLQPATAPKLLAICGLGGIGKTALAIQLVTELNGYFEQVIWLTARADQHPAALVSVLLEMLSASADDAAQLGANSSDDSSFYSGDYCSVKRTRGLIRQLLARLSQQRVLVIIDGFEQVFIKGNAEAEARAKTPTFEANRQQQASLYVEDLAGYGELIDAFQQPVSNGVMTGEMTGVSALLLTSREKPRELLALPAGSCCASLYSLGGLKVHEAARMLSLFELKGDATDYKALIERYSGHPMALRLALNAIEGVFAGSIREFLDQKISVFDELRSVLNQQFERLSALEIEAMYWLAINHSACTLEDLQADIVAEDHKTNLLYTLRSLERRFLIEVVRLNGPSYQLHPMVAEYVLSVFVRETFTDLIDGNLSFFNSYALMKADAEDSSRTFQQSFIVRPILDRLSNHLKSLFAVDEWLNKRLDDFREGNAYRLGYAGGNFVNLMVALSQGKLSDKDFSKLMIWQAYLQGAELRSVNFNRCELNRSVFTETLSDVMVVALTADEGRRRPLLACGDTNGSVHIWGTQVDEGSGSDAKQKFAEWSAHNGWVRSLAFTPKKPYVITGGDDSYLKLWQLGAFGADGVAQPRLVWQKKMAGWVRAIALSPDGTMVASGSDNQITLYQVENGHEVCCFLHQSLLSTQITVQPSAATPAKDHPKGLSLIFSPDHQWLASSGGNDVIRIWSVANLLQAVQASSNNLALDQLSGDKVSGDEVSGDEGPFVDLHPAAELEGHSDWVRGMRFSPDSRHLLSASDDGTTRLWTVEGWTCEAVLDHCGARVRSLSISPESALLATGSDDCNVRLWDLNTRECVQTISTKKSRIGSVAFQQLGDRLLLTAGGDKQTLMMWQVHAQLEGVSIRPMRTYRGYTNGIRAVSFLGSQHLISGGDSRELSVWDSASAECRANLSLHQGRIWEIALDRKNARIASASDDHTVRLWDANTGQCLATFAEHTSWVRTVDFSRRGRLLASAGDDGTIRIWNTASGFCVKVIEPGHHWIHSARFDPTNSRYLISGGDEGVVRHWHRKDGFSQPMARHDHRICSVAYSSDAKLVASGSDDSTVILWDVEKGEVCDHFTEPDLSIKTVAFSPGNRYLAAGGEDQIVYLWDLLTPERVLYKLRPDSLSRLAGGIRCVAFSLDGSVLISAGLDATIRIANLSELSSQLPQEAPMLKSLIQPERPYEKIKIEGVKGLSHLQMSNLLTLGAVNWKQSLFR